MNMFHYLVILLYWFPFTVSLIYLSTVLVNNLRGDWKARESGTKQSGTTVGDLLFGSFCIVCPLANWFITGIAALEWLDGFWQWCGKTLKRPLIPPKA